MAAIGMAVGAGIGAMNSISNAYAQSQAIKARATYQATIAKINTEMSTMQAEDSIRRGDIDARNYQKEVDQMIGSQRVAYAAQGVDVDFGSAAAIQEETRMQGAIDALKIRNNAWREAWGYRVEANNSTFAGEFAKIEGKSAAKQTLLTGGMQALSYGVQAASYASNSTMFAPTKKSSAGYQN
jgi:hypothetical protein